MAKIRTYMICLAAILLVLSACGIVLGTRFTELFAAAEGSWVANGNVTSSEEAGNTVYSSNSGLAVVEFKGGDLSAVNTFEAKFCYEGNSASNMEYAGMQINSGDDFFIFAVWPNTASNGPAVTFVQRNTDDPVNRLIRVELDRTAFTKGVWFTMKVILYDDFFEYYLNGTLIASSKGLGYSVGRYTWTRALAVTKGCPTQIKDLALSRTEVDTPEPEKGWVPNANVTENELEGVKVYSTNNQTAVVDYKNGDFTEINTVEAEFKYQGDATTGDREYAGIVVYSASDHYRFAIWPNTASNGPAVLFVQKNAEDPIKRLIRKELPASSFGKGVWYKMKVVLTDEYFALYLNDELICTSVSLDVQVGKFAWSKVILTSKGCPTEIKNPSLSYTRPNFSDYLDFEFSDARGVYAFTSDNATLSQDGGTMKIAIGGANPTIISPSIFVNGGHKYSAKLGVRNTFVVRLKNDSAAAKLKLYYLMRGDEDYSEAQSKEFEIAQNSDFTTYYFNLSDVVNCTCWQRNESLKSCEHYLSGFKLVFGGADSGTIEIDEISFSREERIYEYAATEIVAVADGETNKVTVSGKLLEKYSGKNVTVLQTSVQNYNSDIAFKENVKLASGKANGVDFSVSFPFADGKMNHLSTKFMAVVSDGNDYLGGTKASEVFMIANWRDFSENPYAFTLPKLTVDVTDPEYGAKGDGFTDDTAAIQSAIDYVNTQGGGAVVVPGNNDTYGRRYILTGIRLKSNVELRIETGAILWQSHHESDYKAYTVYHGHSNMGQDVAWGLSALMHLPFVYIRDAENVRVTGGGTIRMDDTGTEWLDGNGYAWDSNITVGCNSVIHLVPIGIYGSKNVEISDINVRRCSCWHAYIRESSNIYFGNVDLAEVNCINGDGFDFSTAVSNVVVDRCSLYSNDDALVMAVTTNDPRDDLSIWRSKSTKADKSLHDFKIVNSNLFGGHGITFIPWASDCPDQYSVRIYNIHVENCVLGGTSTAVGVWADNPFYGKSNYWDGTYGSTDAAEDGDYSPISDVTIVNNKYVSPCNFYGVNVTNVITDAKMIGAQWFENGNFDKKVHKGKGFSDETTFTVGLSYWSGVGNIGTEKVGTKQAYTVDTNEQITQDDYAAYIKGNGELYQGLYCVYGAYKFDLNVKLLGGTATLFARNAKTGEIISSVEIKSGTEFETYTLKFKIEDATSVQLGLMHKGAAGDAVYIDDAVLNTDPDVDMYGVDGDTITQDFDNGEMDFNVKANGESVTVKDGKLHVGSGMEYKLLLNNKGAMDLFDVRVDIVLSVEKVVNAGLYLFANNVGNAQDSIYAYNVQIESRENSDMFNVMLFLFEGKYSGNVASSKSYTIQGDKVTLRAVVKNDTIFVFVNDETKPCIVYQVAEGTKGNVGLRSQDAETVFDNFVLTTKQFVESGGDMTALRKTVDNAKMFSKDGYTEQSYKALIDALAAVDKLTENSKQKEIDAVLKQLKAAINGLVPQNLDQMSKSQLQSVVDAMRKFDADNYTEESFATLTKAIEDAEKVAKSNYSSKADCNAQLAKLTAAANALVAKEKTSPEKSGCGSVVGAASVATLLVVAVAAAYVAKRKD